MRRTLAFIITPIVWGAAMFPVPSAAADQVVVLLKTFAGEGRVRELEERSLKQLEFFREAEPTATFRLYRSAKVPSDFLWYEVYESQAAYDNHLKVVVPKYRDQTDRAAPGLMAKPFETEVYIELAK
jgi:quinol monooxygenase YgiN